MTREVDVIVIGAGAVGENVADYAHQGGLSVALIEEELVGGECSYWACMPSKALLRAGAVLASARQVDGAKQAVTGAVDPAGVFRRRDALTHRFDDSSQVEWAEGAGLEVIRGHARITGERTVAITAPDGSTAELRARQAVVAATGSAALLPDIPGLADIAPWTSREATSAEQVPESLAVIGGGVVAAEMATAYSSLGSRVTMIVRGGALLRGMEPFAADLVRSALEERGVTILDDELASASRAGGRATLSLTSGATVVAEQVLVAIGRTPRTGDLGLEHAGLTPGDWLEVDDTLRVRGVDWLYGVGDVNHRALLTHQGKYQARAAGDAIAARAAGRPLDTVPFGVHVATADHEMVPQVTFTNPEIASVGFTEASARKAGRRIRVLDYDLSGVAGASTVSDDYVGRARAIVDEDRGVLIGATFCGPEVGEMLQSATIAIVGEVPLHRLWHAVPAYPTLSEVWLRFLEAYGRPGR
ncbi:MAG: NAD(P)/FAD-dependent oxidoreductase [Micrococcales bacterium]|nr:NAD(P)/FAD-dependent oxidoreductase [Micrococcales bacterium]